MTPPPSTSNYAILFLDLQANIVKTRERPMPRVLRDTLPCYKTGRVASYSRVYVFGPAGRRLRAEHS
jgi:hypothetical protein